VIGVFHDFNGLGLRRSSLIQFLSVG
jgi:hypothetical protein